MHVLQEGDIIGFGVGSSKGSREDSGLLVRKVTSMQIPIKPVIRSSITSTSTVNLLQENVYRSKAQNKRISINEVVGVSSSFLVKSTSNVNPKDKGKCVLVEKTV